MSSCTQELVLCELSELEHRSPISIEYDWSNSPVIHDTMEVLAYRPFHMTKYHYSAVQKSGTQWSLDSLYDWQKPIGVGKDEHPELLRAGDYWISTFHQRKPYVQLSLSDSTDILSALQMEYAFSFKEASQHPLGQEMKYPKWIDFNPEYPYFYDDGSGCFDRITACSDGKKLELQFAPKSFSQRVLIQFDIQLAEKEIHIDSIKAEISGVTRNKQLLSGYLDTDASLSGRLLFKPKLNVSSEDPLLLHASQTIYGLGFLAPVSSDMKTGPGIINMAIYTRYKSESGLVKQRTVFAGINLYEAYRQHPLTIISEDGRHRMVSSMQEVIQVLSPIKIYGKDFVEDNNKENGVDIWTMITDSSTDIEI